MMDTLIVVLMVLGAFAMLQIIALLFIPRAPRKRDVRWGADFYRWKMLDIMDDDELFKYEVDIMRESDTYTLDDIAKAGEKKKQLSETRREFERNLFGKELR